MPEKSNVLRQLAHALALLSCVAFFVVLGSLLVFYKQHGVGLTILLFCTAIPFVITIVWLCHLYFQNRNAPARILVSILSGMGIGFLPLAFYVASNYNDDSPERRIFVILAAIDTVPFVLGLMWFYFLIAKPVRKFR